MGKSTGAVIAAAAILAGFLLWTRGAFAAQTGQNAYGEDDLAPGNDEIDGGAWGSVDAGLMDAQTESDYTGVTMDDIIARRLNAFIFMIVASECGLGRALDGSAWTTLYGGGQFTDMSDHPANLGWRGVKLPDAMCKRAGYGPGCVSTAAGGGQIIRNTWNSLRGASMLHGWPRLPDFSEASQREAIRRQLVLLGADELIAQGDIASAVHKCAGTWASLPGNSYGQNPHALDTVVAYFDRGLSLA